MAMGCTLVTLTEQGTGSLCDDQLWLLLQRCQAEQLPCVPLRPSGWVGLWSSPPGVDGWPSPSRLPGAPGQAPWVGAVRSRISCGQSHKTAALPERGDRTPGCRPPPSSCSHRATAGLAGEGSSCLGLLPGLQLGTSSANSQVVVVARPYASSPSQSDSKWWSP